MPRLIFKCPHIKGGTSSSASHLGNYVKYMATRDGAERVQWEQDQQPATEQQKKLVAQIVRDFPLSCGMFEYEDYQTSPTQGNASDFITRALEENFDRAAKRKNYIQYIANRPHAQRIGAHGLFTSADGPLTLSQVAEAVSSHPGTVWLPIISLRREDAARLGYDNAESWRNLLSSYAMEMAQGLKIPWEDFRWYAAFHNESHHPHIHMVCYSADPTKGFLTKQGIADIKSGLAKEIFRNELTELYRQQTQRRDTLNQDAETVMQELLRRMEDGTADNPRMEELMTHLADRLRFTSGKKQYGYLKAPLKAVVDEIVDELAKDPRVTNAYDLWYQMREEVLRTYRNDLPERLPLSQQKEFKRIKNMVIQEATRLGELNQVFQPEENVQEQHEKDEEQSPNKLERLRQAAERGNPSAQYHLGKLLLQGNEIPKDAKDAVRWLMESAEQGNQYAQYALGKIYLLGKDAPKDFGTARMWFQRSADQGNQYAQYFVEHMDNHRTAPSAQSVIRLLYHMANIFREQTPPSAPGGMRSGVDRKLRRKIWEKKIAMGHKPDDHEEPMMNL